MAMVEFPAMGAEGHVRKDMVLLLRRQDRAAAVIRGDGRVGIGVMPVVDVVVGCALAHGEGRADSHLGRR